MTTEDEPKRVLGPGARGEDEPQPDQQTHEDAAEAEEGAETNKTEESTVDGNT